MPCRTQYRHISIVTMLAGTAFAVLASSTFASPCEPIVEAVAGGTDGPVRTMVSAARGDSMELYIGGLFELAGGEVMNNIAMWDGGAWNDYQFLPLDPPNIGIAGSGGGLDAIVAIPNPFDPINGDEWLLVAGDHGPVFPFAEGVRMFRPVDPFVTNDPVAAADTAVSGFGISSMVTGEVGGVQRAFLGGAFNEVGGQNVLRLAMRSLEPFNAPWGPVGMGDYISASVEAMAVVEDDDFGAGLYICGSFADFGDALPMANSIARWDGNEFHTLSTGLIDSIPGQPTQATAITFGDIGSGPMLFVGGTFVEAGGVAVQGVAAWDGTEWHALGDGITSSGFGSPVNALEIFDDGSGPALYAGGIFDSAGSQSASNLARWNGSAWEPVGSGANGPVFALHTHDDGSGAALYIAGEFTELNGVAVNNIARLRSCESSACADVTGDQAIDLADLNLVLANFGQATVNGDANADGFVDLADLNAVLANFGQTCQ